MNPKSVIESLMYVFGNDGVDVADIKRVLDLPTDEIRNHIKAMKKAYEDNPDSGLTIKEYGNHFYLLTKPVNKEAIGKLYDVHLKNTLTPAMCEVLAIIAYNNPCTAVKVDEKRQISSESAIRRLENLGLINNLGRDTTPGRPYLYEVTQKFFNLFGLKNIHDLPPLKNDETEIENLDFFNSNRTDE